MRCWPLPPPRLPPAGAVAGRTPGWQPPASRSGCPPAQPPVGWQPGWHPQGQAPHQAHSRCAAAPPHIAPAPLPALAPLVVLALRAALTCRCTPAAPAAPARRGSKLRCWLATAVWWLPYRRCYCCWPPPQQPRGVAAAAAPAGWVLAVAAAAAAVASSGAACPPQPPAVVVAAVAAAPQHAVAGGCCGARRHGDVDDGAAAAAAPPQHPARATAAPAQCADRGAASEASVRPGAAAVEAAALAAWLQLPLPLLPWLLPLAPPPPPFVAAPHAPAVGAGLPGSLSRTPPGSWGSGWRTRFSGGRSRTSRAGSCRGEGPHGSGRRAAVSWTHCCMWVLECNTAQLCHAIFI